MRSLRAEVVEIERARRRHDPAEQGIDDDRSAAGQKRRDDEKRADRPRMPAEELGEAAADAGDLAVARSGETMAIAIIAGLRCRNVRERISQARVRALERGRITIGRAGVMNPSRPRRRQTLQSRVRLLRARGFRYGRRALHRQVLS